MSWQVVKLSKTSGLCLALGVLAIAVASLSVAVSQQDRERGRLKKELREAQVLLNKYGPQRLSVRQTGADGQLSQVQSSLDSVKNRLGPTIDSIDVTNTILKDAQSSKVVISEIGSQGPSGKNVKGVQCSVLTVTMKVEGEVRDIAGFVLLLTEKLPTGVLESLTISVPSPPGEPAAPPAGAAKPVASVKLSVYKYEGT